MRLRYPADFLAAWEAYPRQYRGNKRSAFERFDILVPHDVDLPAAIEAMKTTANWRRGYGIPTLANFIEGEYWENAPLPAKADPLREAKEAAKRKVPWAEDTILAIETAEDELEVQRIVRSAEGAA